MSGFVGLVRADAEPIEPRLIRDLTRRLARWGPDGQAVWCDGPAALGHARLRTGPDSDIDRQPLTLDGQVWIVADARVDAREELTAALGLPAASCQLPASSISDAELILRAYLKWGNRCVDHLLGDFSFVVWDDSARRLFCARDHLGVKPFCYAHLGSWILVSSALECLRGHPSVSDHLNDLAIADFLLFGVNQDPAGTAFRDIRRLPPAHTLAWSASGLDVRPYWTLPVEGPIYYRSDGEYVDQFMELVRQAVSDRLRTERVGIFMSGGLDSSMLAATAANLLGGQPTVSDPVHAFTLVYDSLIPDSERQYAEMAAERLGIPIHCYVMDEVEGWPRCVVMNTPEPLGIMSDREPELRCYSEMAAHSRVAFYGEGPDNALSYEWQPYLAYLWRGRRWRRLLTDFGKFLAHHRRVPLLPTVPRLVRDRLHRKQFEPAFPGWLAPELVDRLHLRDRWREVNATPAPVHPVRPRAYASLLTTLWQLVFEASELSYTGVPLEVRYPYLDIRLLRFLLRVPVVPWCRRKHLVRCALNGVVPEAVRRRPKTALSGNPAYARVRLYGLPPAVSSRRLATYGAVDRLSQRSPGTIPAVEADLRFVALSHWLEQLESVDPSTVGYAGRSGQAMTQPVPVPPSRSKP